MAEAINIIVYKAKDARVDFVEIETDDHRSISIGERIPHGKGYTRIRITKEDIEKA